jgi:hypothetical protein
MNTENEEQGRIQPPTSTSVDPPSGQPTHESVKVTVTAQMDPTPTNNTPEPQNAKSDSKSAVQLPPPGMGKKAQKRARAAERIAKLAALPLKMVETMPAGLKKPSDTICQYTPGPVVVDGTRRSSPGSSRVSISQKQTTITTKSGKGTSTNLTTLTVRPILRWPNIENVSNIDSVNGNVDSATNDQLISLSSSKRVPTGPKGLEGIMTKDCGFQVRGRGQVQGTRSDDGSSRLRMDAWNACLKSG